MALSFFSSSLNLLWTKCCAIAFIKGWSPRTTSMLRATLCFSMSHICSCRVIQNSSAHIYYQSFVLLHVVLTCVLFGTLVGPERHPGDPRRPPSHKRPTTPTTPLKTHLRHLRTPPTSPLGTIPPPPPRGLNFQSMLL
jgi:hypothetical protein